VLYTSYYVVTRQWRTGNILDCGGLERVKNDENHISSLNLGSALSSPSEVWGGAPAEIESALKSDSWWQQF